MNRDQRGRQRELRLRIYGPMPTIACKGLCIRSCGPLGMSALEYDIIEEVSGRPLDVDEEGTCTHLVRGRCSVYRDRPLICRLFGVAEGIECEHGCKPSRVLPRADALMLISRAAELGGASKFGPLSEALLAHVDPRIADLTGAQAFRVYSTSTPGGERNRGSS